MIFIRSISNLFPDHRKIVNKANCKYDEFFSYKINQNLRRTTHKELQNIDDDTHKERLCKYNFLRTYSRPSGSSTDEFTMLQFFSIFYKQLNYGDYWQQYFGILFLDTLCIYSILKVIDVPYTTTTLGEVSS